MKLSFLISLIFSLVACTTIGIRPDTVVERSAPDRPSWTEGQYTDESPTYVNVTFVKSEVFRLELGIKQAQVAAVQNTKQLIIDRVLVELKKYRKHVGASKSAEVAFNKAVADLKDRYKNETEASPKTVYWEKVRRETPEGTKTDYTIYCLLNVSRNEFNYALKTAAKSVQNFPDESARRVANQILKDLANDVILKDQ